jgi:hypothetical protein
LQLDAVLLAVVARVRATGVVVVVASIAVCLRRVIGRRWRVVVAVVVAVVVVRLRGVCSTVGAGASGPAGAVEGLAAGLAAATRGYAAAKCVRLWCEGE